MGYLFYEMMSILVFVLIGYTIIPFVLYIIARWRDSRSEVPDAQLGYKFGLHLFRFYALSSLLSAAAFLLIALFYSFTYRFQSEPFQMVLGMAIPAGVILFGCLKLLTDTNDAEYPGVGRLFNGVLWIIVTFIVIGSFSVFVMMIVMGAIDDDTWQVPVALLLVMGPASMYLGKQVKEASTA